MGTGRIYWKMLTIQVTNSTYAVVEEQGMSIVFVMELIIRKKNSGVAVGTVYRLRKEQKRPPSHQFVITYGKTYMGNSSRVRYCPRYYFFRHCEPEYLGSSYPQW